MEQSDWTSYNQLIQELIGGTIRRNTFSRCELDLLLDLQMARVRKSSRPDLLRRYQRSVHRQFVAGAPIPQRLYRFMEVEAQQRAANAFAGQGILPKAS